MQLTREFCPEFVWEGSQPVSEHTSFDSLCLQELMGLQTLGILYIGIPARVRQVDKNSADANLYKANTDNDGDIIGKPGKGGTSEICMYMYDYV